MGMGGWVGDSIFELTKGGKKKKEKEKSKFYFGLIYFSEERSKNFFLHFKDDIKKENWGKKNFLILIFYYFKFYFYFSPHK